MIMMNICHTGLTVEDIPAEEALSILEKEGATVVGVNCGWGPPTVVPLMKKIRQKCKVY